MLLSIYIVGLGDRYPRFGLSLHRFTALITQNMVKQRFSLTTRHLNFWNSLAYAIRPLNLLTLGVCPPFHVLGRSKVTLKTGVPK